MANIVMVLSFKLRADVSAPDFLQASDKIQEDYLSKCKGYVSRTLFVDGEVWTDLVIWETMEDAEKAMMGSPKNQSAVEFSELIGEMVKEVVVSAERNY